MTEDFIKKLLKAGKLKELKAGVVQSEELLKQAILDLEEVRKIINIAEKRLT